MKYKAGDKVKIVSRRTLTMNQDGKMDKYLGTVMTIKRVKTSSYEMLEDSGRWFWGEKDIECLVSKGNQMKTMTIEELKERGLKIGDIAFFNSLQKWMMVASNFKAKSIMQYYDCSVWKNSPKMAEDVLSIILKEDWQNSSAENIINLFHSEFDYPRNLITKIIDRKIAKYVHAVHFGSNNLYTWRVPERLNKVNFKAGDIVEVDTMYGNQYVQVKETAEYEYDEKTKEVINLIKADEIPF